MRNKLIKLMEKESFILILFLCVCLVAGGTLFLSMRNINNAKRDVGDMDFVIIDGEMGQTETREEEQEIYPVERPELEDLHEMEVGQRVEDIDNQTSEEEEESIEVGFLGDESEEVEEEELEFEDEDLEEENQESEKDWESVEETMAPSSFILPVEGDLITEFTSNTLVYSKTLDSWIGHAGIDIKAKEGSFVKAAGDGVIKKVYKDDLWGIVIVIDHGDELLTKYSNLATMDMVKEGIEVKKGDHIAKTGRTAGIEMMMEDHLHFEVIKNGKIIDPRSIMD